jgi:putative flippase GtrA
MTIEKAKIIILYAVFAAIAIASNLLTQIIVISLYSGQFSIALSILLGTAVGLPVKYVLDKKFIFNFTTLNFAHNSKVFILYVLMAIFTTMLFWGTEALFQILFNNETMRLLGGAIGLIAGYVMKYQLDKKFVFTTHSQGVIND